MPDWLMLLVIKISHPLLKAQNTGLFLLSNPKFMQKKYNLLLEKYLHIVIKSNA